MLSLTENVKFNRKYYEFKRKRNKFETYWNF